MPEKSREISGFRVDFTCRGQTTQESGHLLGVAAMVVETARQEALDSEVELRFRPRRDSPLVVARGVVAAHLAEGGLRVNLTELEDEYRRHLLELLYPPGEDRRAAVRASLVTQIRTVVGGQALVGYTRDISTGGVFVETENPPAPGTDVKVRFKLRPESPIAEVQATVIYTLRGEGMGLRFLQLPRELREAIEAFVSEKQES